ncbi:MAG: GAF domain-containing protein [Deltaproteobacteria bacterium]|nr:GAF domain-containing protein [Deltaproteobacteria bacterium]
MEKTRIAHYIKPKHLQDLLRRNAAFLEVPLVLRDDDGNVIAEFPDNAFSSSNAESMEICPVSVRGKLLGTLSGYGNPPFTGERLRKALKNVVAHLTDLILCEVKLDSMSEELLHNYKVLNLFYNVSNSLVNILNVRKVCNIILERIVATIGLSKASVLLLDKTRENLMVVAHKGLPEDEVENILFPLSESVCKDAILKAKPLFIQNIDHYPGLKDRSRGEYRSNSFISVPILKSSRRESQEVLGVINVADKSSGDPFYSGDMKLIVALTSLAAMSIQNATYFEEVARTKEEWESTFDAITDAVAILDHRFHLVKVNKAYRNSGFGGGKNLAERTCHEILYHKKAPCAGCPATETLKKGKPAYAEKKVGSRIYRQWTYPMFDDEGKCLSVVMYTRDVTHLKKLKERLIQSERMASIGQIAAGVAHEIRNPLGSIVTAVEVLSSEGGTDEENAFTLTEVLKVEARRLNDIISEFLLYAAPQQPVLKENHLNRVIGEVIRMAEGEAKKNGVAIVMDLDDRIPSTSFDAGKIKQVIWNLVINGIQAMRAGGTLKISSHRRADGIEFRVSDEGEGIRQKDVTRIFDPFYTTKSSGTGLGLSIVNRIVEDHHGRIEIESEEGKGAEFIVQLLLGNEESYLETVGMRG